MTGAFRRNVKWQLAGSAGQAVLSAIYLIFTGRELGTTSFGVFSIVMGFVYVANLIVEPRMQDVAARQFWDFGAADQPPGGHAQHFIDLFVVESLGKLVPAAALVVLSAWLAERAHLPPGSAGLIVVAALGTYLSRIGFGLSLGFLRVLGRSDLNALCATLELIVRLALTFALALAFQLTALGCIVALSLSGILGNALQLALAVWQLKGSSGELRSWKPGEARARLRGIRRLLLSNLAISTSDLMNKDLDVTLIAPLMPAAQVGIYKMAKNVVLLTWRAVDPFTLALMPELNRLVALGDLASVRRLLVRSSAGLFALALVLSAVSFGLLVLLGGVVLGPSYEFVPSLMPLMMVGVVGSAGLVWGHPLAVAFNRPHIALLGSLIGSGFGFLAFLLLTPRYGTYGAASAWALTFLLNFTATAGMSYRLLRARTGAAA